MQIQPQTHDSQNYSENLSHTNNSKIIINDIQHTRHILYNNPDKRNSITVQMMLEFAFAIQQANKSAKIKFITVSGVGKYFTVGFENYNVPTQISDQLEIQNHIQKIVKIIFKRYVDSIIDSKKPIFAIVHGKVQDIGFSQLPLFDKVYAVKDTKFQLSSQNYKMGPHMCSSYTFPRQLSLDLAHDLLISGKMIDSQILQKSNFLKTFNSLALARSELGSYLDELSKIDYNSLLQCRRLIRFYEVQKLKQTNLMQSQHLMQRWIYYHSGVMKSKL